MYELCKKSLINEDAMTYSSKTMKEMIDNHISSISRNDVIRPIDNPYSDKGGIAVLFGSLAPKGSVVKRSAVAQQMMKHTGPARVFNSEEEAYSAIYSGSSNKGM